MPTLSPDQLLRHLDTGAPWPPHGGDGFADLPAAYAIALAVRALRIGRGEQPRGYKIGFTNRTIWPRYGVFAPIWGTIWDTTLAHADDGQGTLWLDTLCQPRIEPEAVFGFARTPPAGADLPALFDALDWVAPGFEVVQSHQPDWKFTAAQTVADSGLHGRLLVGPRTPVRQLAPDADGLQRLLAGARARLYRGDDLIDAGHGANVLDSPLHALAHFLAELRACPGAADIAPGDVVTTGTWTDAWPVLPGQDWSVTFDTVLPGLAVRFGRR